ncbi:MAG TPA: Mut7-C RNAse domain-containing protein [Candidatus Eisenbacteria bacterium]
MRGVRFITDSSLDFLARRMRFLGYDIVTARGARLEELFEAARREGRMVLTLSPRHPRRYADVAALTVPRGDPGASLRGLAAAFEPSGPPFSRCALCNTALEHRHPLEARGEVPGRVLRTSGLLSHCPTCGKWYWAGSHVDRLRAWLERAVGRTVGDPEPPPGGGPEG